MNATRSRLRGRYAAPLALESLEPRRLLAQYEFMVNLYEDAGGTPGALIAGDTVEAGDTFFVEITADDLRAAPQGLKSMGMHVGWDPAVFEEIDAAFDPSDPASGIVTDSFPLDRSGKLDAANGVIYNLRGAAMPSLGCGQLIGIDGPEQFALLRFKALQAAEDSPLVIQAAGSVGFVPMPIYASPSDLRFEVQTISVVEPAATSETHKTEILVESTPEIDEGATAPADFLLVETATAASCEVPETLGELSVDVAADVDASTEIDLAAGPSRWDVAPAADDLPLLAGGSQDDASVQIDQMDVGPPSYGENTQPIQCTLGDADVTVETVRDSGPVEITADALCDAGSVAFTVEVVRGPVDSFVGPVARAVRREAKPHADVAADAGRRIGTALDTAGRLGSGGVVDMASFGQLNLYCMAGRPATKATLLRVASPQPQSADAVFAMHSSDKPAARHFPGEMEDLLATVAAGWFGRT